MDNRELKKNLGKNIKFYRKRAGYTQDKFAEKIDIAPQTLSSIETGVSFPNSVNLCKILNGLNISILKLFAFPADIVNSDIEEVDALIIDRIKSLDNESKSQLVKYLDFLLASN